MNFPFAATLSNLNNQNCIILLLQLKWLRLRPISSMFTVDLMLLQPAVTVFIYSTRLSPCSRDKRIAYLCPSVCAAPRHLRRTMRAHQLLFHSHSLLFGTYAVRPGNLCVIVSKFTHQMGSNYTVPICDFAMVGRGDESSAVLAVDVSYILYIRILEYRAVIFARNLYYCTLNETIR